MLVCNYEKREVVVVYFKETTGKKRLPLLNNVCTALWESGAMGGLKCLAEKFLFEAKFRDSWKTYTLFCGKVGDDEGVSISYKRMLALIYEMSCSNIPADEAAMSLAKVMKNDNGVTKMYLSLVQATLTVRPFGTLQVSPME
jgi:hypothetical protein